MVVLPLSDRRPASTLMAAKCDDFLKGLEGARSSRRDVINPSIRSRSMDPGLAAWGLPSSEEVSIITWGTILLLFLLIVISVRTMVSTRTFRRRPATYLRDVEEAAVHVPGGQQRLRATLKIGVDLEDSPVNLIDLCPQPYLDTEAPPSYNTAVAHPNFLTHVSQPSAAIATSRGRQHVRTRSSSNRYIRITVLVAIPRDATNDSLGSLRRGRVPRDLTESGTYVTDSEDSSTYSDSEDEWDQILPPRPLSPSTEASLHPYSDLARAHTGATATAQG